MGMLAALRSRAAGGQFIGLMITASHNPEIDNGIKLTDPSGYMLSQEWEPLAEALANAVSEAEAMEVVTSIYSHFNFDETGPAFVIIGRDSRPHSGRLSDLVKSGAEAMSCCVLDLGEVTTPQLHFSVQKANQRATNSSCSFVFDELTAETALKEYFDTLSSGFMQLLSSIPLLEASGTGMETTKINMDLIIDASFGVGTKAALDITKYLEKYSELTVSLDIRNMCGEGCVNEGAPDAWGCLLTFAIFANGQHSLYFPFSFHSTFSFLSERIISLIFLLDISLKNNFNGTISHQAVAQNLCRKGKYRPAVSMFQ